MSRAGISGVGVISARGEGAEATRSALFAPSPRLPEPPRRIETELPLTVFEIPVPDIPEIPGLPLRFLLRALDEALADARRGKDMSVPGANVKMMRLLAKLLPHSLVMQVWMKIK